MDVLPLYSEDLIKALDEQFPEKCPTTDMTDRAIWYYAGMRKMVTLLLARLEYTKKKSLTGKLLGKEA